MAKILKDTELADIVQRVTQDPAILEDIDLYQNFLHRLADLLTDYFGGERRRSAGMPDDDLGWTVGIHLDDQVPEDGGIWKDYDTDVVWQNGLEGEKGPDGFVPTVPGSGRLVIPSKYLTYGPVSAKTLDEIENRINFSMTGDRRCFVDTEALVEALATDQLYSPHARVIVQAALDHAKEQAAGAVEFYC